jgi:uroporphyrinogen decarboxylase
MSFQPNYKNMIDVLNNKKPNRLPLYEHIISPNIMENILDIKFTHFEKSDSDLDKYFKHYCNFFKEMTYDTVSYEIGIVGNYPNSGAIMGGKPGPIQTWEDFNNFPWDEIPDRFWSIADKKFEALIKNLPSGMKALGGVGNGVFEISEDLVGFENLCMMMGEEPELFATLMEKIGDIMFKIWKSFLEKYSEHFPICRFGDDLGFQTNTLIPPYVIREHIIPQYERVIKLVHSYNSKFLLHSCGNIFKVMDDLININIDGKHSNEDNISPYEKWIELYGNKIGLLGGIDVDILTQNSADDVYKIVIKKGKRFRKLANGFALGSGNSIPDYVPPGNYLAMVKAVKYIRQNET